MTLSLKFVTTIPVREQLEDGVLYISMDYGTAIHKCACGCGNEVVTPFSPSGWKLIFDGRTFSLTPSIGNWSFPCQSHYWITNNMVKWVPKWTKEQMKKGNREESYTKKGFKSLFNFLKKK